MVVDTIDTEDGNTREGNQLSYEAGIVEGEGKNEFGPWILVRRQKAGPNSRGGRNVNQIPGLSPKNKPNYDVRSLCAILKGIVC